MKVAVLSPTTSQLVEKYAVLFPEGIDVVGPVSDDRHHWNDYSRRLPQWEQLGLHITLDHRPYHDINFSQYDVLFESAETFGYCRDWLNNCHRLECPIILKACWSSDPVLALPRRYIRKVRHFPVLLEMPAHAPNWERAGFTDVNVIHNPVGDWWFSEEWNGTKEQILFVLSGAKDKSWRADIKNLGFELWQEIERRYPGSTYHHDGNESYKTPEQMAQMFRESRVFINLDQPYGNGERPLTLAFTEALAAGLPVVARDLPGLSFRTLIDSNGVCTNDMNTMYTFIDRCLTDWAFAKQCSNRSREIAHERFSNASLIPKYHSVIERAQRHFVQVKSKAAVEQRFWSFVQFLRPSK